MSVSSTGECWYLVFIEEQHESDTQPSELGVRHMVAQMCSYDWSHDSQDSSQSDLEDPLAKEKSRVVINAMTNNLLFVGCRIL